MTGITQPTVIRRLAIFAHFDPAGGVGDHVLQLLQQVQEVATDIVIVSTRLSEEGRAALAGYGTVLVRTNLGYDFASWRHGLDLARRALDLHRYDAIMTLNDSIYTLRDRVLADAFETMDRRPVDIWSLTLSHQVATHLQSYCIVFARAAFQSVWFDQFWSSVWEYGDRSFVVANYELGLTSSAIAAGLRIGALFDARMVPTIAAIDRGLNPTHRLWEHVARDVGIVKVELLARNPHRLDISALPTLATPQALDAITSHGSARSAPLAHPSCTPIMEAAGYARRSEASVAVHIHLHFAELVDELLLVTRRLPIPCDVFVTVTDKRNLGAIVRRIKAHRREARVLLVENRGRDILPFLSLLNAGVFEPYAAVCKLHSKRSTYSENGAAWRRQLIAPLLGSSLEALRILDAFRQRPELGLVVPAGSFVRDARHWGGNQPRVEGLAQVLDPRYGPDRTPLAFPAGSMYWFRPGAMAPLRALNLEASAFEIEQGAQDGTLAHVVERLTALSCWAAGYGVAETDDLAGALQPVGVDRSVIPVL